MQGNFRHPVQLYEAFGLFVIGVLLLYIIAKKIRARFIILSYLGSYSLLRFFTEMFRGDMIRGQFIYGLSPSQWIAMVIAIGCLIYILTKRKSLFTLDQ